MARKTPKASIVVAVDSQTGTSDIISSNCIAKEYQKLMENPS